MLCNTNSSSFSKKGVIGSLVLSCLRCAATARMPSLFGMFEYRDETSKVTRKFVLLINVRIKMPYILISVTDSY